MNEELHIPWERPALKELIQRIINTGETTKVDFKLEFNLEDIQQKAELLKDISAIVNTYDHHYRNHGFIVFGVSLNRIENTDFPNNEDHLQATIDDLINKYIGPFITTHLYVFEDDNQKWGVLVIPPTRNAPHIFIKDIHKRYRGDIYVRNGTTTEKATPEDFVRFYRQHLEEHTYEFKQQILELQSKILDLDKQLKQIKRNSTKRILKSDPEKRKMDQPQEILPVTISERIDMLLTKEEDEISKRLFEEANKINALLQSDEIPWLINTTNKELSVEILSKLESTSNELWSAIVSLVMKDDKNQYADTLIKVIERLAIKFEPASGITFTDIGKSIRYFPILIALYLICICGVERKREKLLSKLLKLNLYERSYYTEPLPITYVLFLIRRSETLFDPFYEGYPNRRWCDPVASYCKILLDKKLNFQNGFIDKESAFFKGELILCLSPMDIIDQESSKPFIEHPSSGLYLYSGSATPILSRFLRLEKEWIKTIFYRPLEELLTKFDETAPKFGRGSGCWADGFSNGALAAAFPEKVNTHKK
jgi:hypothetical protein